jgi:hypothetical protein
LAAGNYLIEARRIDVEQGEFRTRRASEIAIAAPSPCAAPVMTKVLFLISKTIYSPEVVTPHSSGTRMRWQRSLSLQRKCRYCSLFSRCGLFAAARMILCDWPLSFISNLSRIKLDLP